MLELPEEWLSILRAIRGGSVAWREPRELADGLGRPFEAALDAMAAMHVAGWLDVWERDDGLVVTLSPRAAAGLGTHLVETRRADLPRWSRPDEARREGARVPSRGGAGPEAVDPRDGRLMDPGAGEEGPGPPTLLVGVGLCPWPGPRQARPPDPCPACHGARLGPDAYCLRCDRWGRLEEGLSPLPGRTGGSRPTAGAEAMRASRRARRKALLKALAGPKAPGRSRRGPRTTGVSGREDASSTQP